MNSVFEQDGAGFIFHLENHKNVNTHSATWDGLSVLLELYKLGECAETNTSISWTICVHELHCYHLAQFDFFCAENKNFIHFHKLGIEYLYNHFIHLSNQTNKTGLWLLEHCTWTATNIWKHIQIFVIWRNLKGFFHPHNPWPWSYWSGGYFSRGLGAPHWMSYFINKSWRWRGVLFFVFENPLFSGKKCHS